MKTIRAISVCVLMVLARDTVAGEQEDLVANCRDGYLQARSAIRSLICTVEVKTFAQRVLNPPTGKMIDVPASGWSLRWVEDGDVARAKLTMEQYSEEYSWNNGVLKILKEGPGKDGQQPYGRIEGANGIGQVVTLWQLVIMPRPDEFLEEIKKIKITSVGMSDLNGNSCCKLSIYKDGWRKDMWFDIKKNYLIRRVDFYAHGDANAANNIQEVTQFIEHKPGIFFPASVKETRLTATFRDVEINEPVAPSRLEFQFPPGTKVTDNRKGVYYVVGEDEQPVGALEPVAKHEILLPTGLETPRSYRTYWILAAVAAVCVLLAIYLRRRVLAKREL